MMAAIYLQQCTIGIRMHALDKKVFRRLTIPFSSVLAAVVSNTHANILFKSMPFL